MMNLYYHSDIISKIVGAFKCELTDAKNAYQLVETLAIHRLENFKETPDDPATQVTKTLYAALATRENKDGNEEFIAEHILCAPYTPETLQDEGIKRTLISMCARGRFIPFMVTVDQHDATSKNNIAVVVAGIGENPEVNFMVMTINVPGVVNEMKLQFDETNSDMAHVIYPLSFDVANSLITAILTKDLIHVRTFLLKADDDTAPKEDANAVTV